jgi:hypothetical protein
MTAQNNNQVLESFPLQLSTNDTVKDIKIAQYGNGHFVTLYKRLKSDTINLEAQHFDASANRVGKKISITQHPFIGSIAVGITEEAKYGYYSFLVGWSTLANAISDWQIHLRYYRQNSTYYKSYNNDQDTLSTPKDTRGLFSMSFYNNTAIVSTISPQRKMVFEKYSILHGNIQLQYYKEDQNCLEGSTNIISKISTKGTLAIGWSSRSNIYLQHYTLSTGDTMGSSAIINANPTQLFLDTQNRTSVIGWTELPDDCGKDSSYHSYKAQMISVTGITKGPITLLNQMYYSTLQSINLLTNQTFSVVLSTPVTIVLLVYNNRGDQIFNQDQELSCTAPSGNSAQRRKFLIQKNEEDLIMNLISNIFSLILFPCKKNVNVPLVRNDLKPLYGVIPLVLIMNLPSIYNKVNNYFQSTTIQNKCKEKLLPQSSTTKISGNNYKPVFIYSNNKLDKILYQGVTSTDVVLNYIPSILATSIAIINQYFFGFSSISSIANGESIVAYSAYSNTDAANKLFLEYRSATAAKLGVSSPLTLSTITNGTFSLITKDSNAIFAYANNPYNIDIKKVVASALDTNTNPPIVQQIEFGEPLLLYSKVLDDKVVFVYGSPAYSEIHLQIRNTNDLSLFCAISKPIKVEFSHISIDAYYNSNVKVIAVAWQNTYKDTENSFDPAYVQKYDGSCSLLSEKQSFYLGTSVEKLDTIKLIDKTFTLVSMSEGDKKIFKVFKGSDMWKPDGTPDNNPNILAVNNPQYLGIDYIKTPWVPEEEPDCEGTDIFTSYIDGGEIKLQGYHIVRHEGNYDN